MTLDNCIRAYKGRPQACLFDLPVEAAASSEVALFSPSFSRIQAFPL